MKLTPEQQKQLDDLQALQQQPDEPSAITQPVAIQPNSNVQLDPQLDPKEAQVQEIAMVASQTAAQWIHNPKSVNALAQATGLAPLFIHLGFMFAHLFQHHATQAGLAVPEIINPPAK